MPDQRPKRPTLRDAAVIDRAAEAMWPRIQAWDGHDPLRDDKADLRKALRWNTDGFKLARDLDAWCPDAALVEILDGAAFALFDALNEETKAWVAANGIAASLPVGAKVSFVDSGKTQTGEVTRVHSDVAKYTVFCEALGHVRSGTGTHGFVLAVEDVEMIDG